MRLVRIWLAALGLALGTASASAQFEPSEQLRICILQHQTLENLLLGHAHAVAAAIGPAAPPIDPLDDWEGREDFVSDWRGTFDDFSAKIPQPGGDWSLTRVARTIAELRIKCDQLAGPPQVRPRFSDIRRLIAQARALLAAHQRDLARFKRAIAALRQRYLAARRARGLPAVDVPVSAAVWTRPRIEIGGDLGGTLSLNSPNLDPFNQKLKRGGGVSGGGGIVFAWPLAERFDVRFGGTVFHFASDAERIDNILVPGSLAVTGHYDTTALLGMVGFGFRPTDRWYIALDGGLGAGFNDLLLRSAATGATIVANRETVTAGMVRGTLTFAVTDQLRVGGFLMHLLTRDMNAQVIGGGPFTMGGIRNTTTGLVVIVTPQIFSPN